MKLLKHPFEIRIGDGVLHKPTWTNRGLDFETAGATVSGDGFADIFQEKNFPNVYGLTDIPEEGSNLEIAGDSRYFKIVFVRELAGVQEITRLIYKFPSNLGIEQAPLHGANLTIRKRFSQVRLTGHDQILVQVISKHKLSGTFPHQTMLTTK